MIELFSRKALPIFATRDWHPEDHCSFKAQGGPWPPHCIRETEGAAFHPDVHLPEGAAIVSKAERSDKDAYSGFEDTGLAQRLREMGVSQVVIGGLATDVCVKNTVLDALAAGFEVTVVREAISGVEAEPGDSEQAVAEMKNKGACFVAIDELQV
jgi:nicotinamidase-related amidase